MMIRCKNKNFKPFKRCETYINKGFKPFLNALVFPSCLPAQADIQATYLGNKSPTITGLIENESGGDDAQLVSSYCGKGDGNVYAIAGTDSIHNGTELSLEFNFIVDGYGRSLGAKRGASGDYEFYTKVNSDNFELGLSQDGSNWVSTTFPIPALQDFTWHNIKINYNAGNIEFILDNGTSQNATTTVTSLYNGAGDLYLMASGGFIIWTGKYGHTKLGYAEFNLASGINSTTLYNVGTAGGNAQLQNYTLVDFWSERQDFHHYNFGGYDEWSDGTNIIFAPVDATVTQAGYSFVATRQGGAFHNGCETKIQLPASLKTVIDGDCPLEIGYNDFEEDFNNAHTGFSNREAYKHKYLTFYNRVLTQEEILKVQKCLKILTQQQDNGVYDNSVAVTNNGILVTHTV